MSRLINGSSLYIGNQKASRALIGSNVVWASETRTSYQQAVLDDNPTAYWPCDETSGYVITDIINGIIAEHSGLAHLGGEGVSSFGRSIVLPGGENDHFLTAGGIPALKWLLNDQDLTVEFWMNVNSNGQDGYVSSRTSSNTADQQFSVFAGVSANEWAIDLGTGSVGRWQTAQISTVNAWQQIVLTYVSATGIRRLYRNGTPYAMRTQPASGMSGHVTADAGPLHFGTLGGNVAYKAQGRMSNIAITIGKALTDERIAAHYAARASA